MVEGARELLGVIEPVLYIVVLLAGTISVILYVAGWGKGLKNMGIMFVSYILIKVIIRGL